MPVDFSMQPRKGLAPTAHRRANYWVILGRCWRLRCPICGGGKQFDGLLRMRPACDRCGYVFDREPGYFLGSIYINYGLTALLITALYVAGYFLFDVPSRVLLIALTAFCVLFPLWFFRYARSLWMGFDTFWDPVARPTAEGGGNDPAHPRPADGGANAAPHQLHPRP